MSLNSEEVPVTIQCWSWTGQELGPRILSPVAKMLPSWFLSTDDDEIFIKFPPHANQLAQDHPLRSRWSEGDKKITGSTKKLLCIQVCFLGHEMIGHQMALQQIELYKYIGACLTTCCFTTFVQLLLSRFVCIQAVWPTQKTSMSWPKKKRHGTPPTKKVDFAN